MPDAHIGGGDNVVGAMALFVGDRVRAAAEDALGPGALPAAVVSLGHRRTGRSVEQLAVALGVSHSRAVRVVDELAARGLARRDPDPADGRAVAVSLTPGGRRAARRVLAARRRALESCLGPLDAEERAALERIAARVLAGATGGRRDAQRICRLCDAQACGHDAGDCPVTRAADAAEGDAP